MAPSSRDVLLGYSTNVHKGETLDQVYRFLRDFTLPIKRNVFGRGRGGLELRIGIGVARELREEAARTAFKHFLDANGLVLFSVNAFPLLDFHAPRVKERVYEPSWAEEERSRWTSLICEILADLLPQGLTGTVSTLGGAFRREDPAIFRRLAAGYLRVIEALARLEDERGKTVVLAVEPEPCTTFEDARDVIEFFESHLVPMARERGRGASRRGLEDRLRKFFTVNFDTCHLSVLFEDLKGNLEAFRRAGIEVSKIHVTSAIRLENPLSRPKAYREFRRRREPRYLHQFCGKNATGRVIWRGLDLDELPRRLEPERSPNIVELRSHYHVPLHLKHLGLLQTTREETAEAVIDAVQRGRCKQLVLETYTWPFLAREGDLVRGITREFRWLQDLLGVGGSVRGLPWPVRTGTNREGLGHCAPGFPVG